MKERGGKVINMSSMAGQVGMARLGCVQRHEGRASGVSRARLHARWGKYRINVNVVSPSVRTDGLETFEREIRSSSRLRCRTCRSAASATRSGRRTARVVPGLVGLGLHHRQ